MHFNKQTLRALIAIACVSVSATTLQAGFWDWFRYGKRTAPAATGSTVATAGTDSTNSATRMVKFSWKHPMPAATMAASTTATAPRAKRAPQAVHAEQKAPNIVVRILKFVWKHPILTLSGVAICWQIMTLQKDRRWSHCIEGLPVAKNESEHVICFTDFTFTDFTTPKKCIHLDSREQGDNVWKCLNP